MLEIKFILRYFLITIILHSYVKGIHNVDHQSHKALSFQSSHRSNVGNVSSQLYGPWSEWSHCSQSCGTGISKRTRSCDINVARSIYRDENLCPRESVEHKVCTLQLCLPGTPDMREILCSRYNGRLVAGQRAKSWIPVHQGSNPCELRCEAKQERLVYGFGKVEDGTPCSGGLCVDGRCLKIGCDDRLGSSIEADMCGMCGGRNESCVHYKDLFLGQPEVRHTDDRRRNYYDVLILPVGARNFLITQRIGENILAMRDRNIAILLHKSENLAKREHKIAGTVLTRSLEDSNNTEVYRAPGPTTLELYVLVLLRGRNYGIRYEYWLPSERTPDQNFQTTRAPPFYESDVLRTSQQVRTTHKSFRTPVTRPTTASPIYYRTAAYAPGHQEKITKNYGNSLPSFNAQSTSPKYLPIYGPKRKAPLFNAKSFATPLTSRQYPSTRNPIDSDGNVPPSEEDQFSARNGLIAPFFPNYRTQKPAYNYYEKFRNTTFRSPVNVYRQKPDLVSLHQQTQRDSSDPNAKSSQESSAPGGSSKKKKSTYQHHKNESKNDVAYRDANVHNFGARKPNPRWEYKFNGGKANKNGSITTNYESQHQYPTTAVSIAVLPLPGNETKLRRDKKIAGKSEHHSKASPFRGGGGQTSGACGPCHKVKNQARHFCTSDFVIRASVLGYEFVHGETRYELQVLQSFKNTFSLLPREYVWSPDTCRCPKLRIGKEYVIMGRSDNNFRRNESRLLVEKHSFVRTYSLKHDRRLLKLRKNHARKCSSKIS